MVGPGNGQELGIQEFGLEYIRALGVMIILLVVMPLLKSNGPSKMSIKEYLSGLEGLFRLVINLLWVVFYSYICLIGVNLIDSISGEESLPIPLYPLEPTETGSEYRPIDQKGQANWTFYRPVTLDRVYIPQIFQEYFTNIYLIWKEGYRLIIIEPFRCGISIITTLPLQSSFTFVKNFPDVIAESLKFSLSSIGSKASSYFEQKGAINIVQGRYNTRTSPKFKNLYKAGYYNEDSVQQKKAILMDMQSFQSVLKNYPNVTFICPDETQFINNASNSLRLFYNAYQFIPELTSLYPRETIANSCTIKLKETPSGGGYNSEEIDKIYDYCKGRGVKFRDHLRESESPRYNEYNNEDTNLCYFYICTSSFGSIDVELMQYTSFNNLGTLNQKNMLLNWNYPLFQTLQEHALIYALKRILVEERTQIVEKNILPSLIRFHVLNFISFFHLAIRAERSPLTCLKDVKKAVLRSNLSTWRPEDGPSFKESQEGHPLEEYLKRILPRVCSN